MFFLEWVSFNKAREYSKVAILLPVFSMEKMRRENEEIRPNSFHRPSKLLKQRNFSKTDSLFVGVSVCRCDRPFIRMTHVAVFF